jgi:hypothetical protein
MIWWGGGGDKYVYMLEFITCHGSDPAKHSTGFHLVPRAKVKSVCGSVPPCLGQDSLAHQSLSLYKCLLYVYTLNQKKREVFFRFLQPLVEIWDDTLDSIITAYSQFILIVSSFHSVTCANDTLLL